MTLVRIVGAKWTDRLRHGGHISKNTIAKANAKRTVRHIVQTVLQTIQQLHLIKMVVMRYFTQFGNGGNHAENIYNFMLFGGYVCTRHRNVRPK